MKDPIASLVVTLFSSPGVAIGLAGTILIFGIGLIVYSAATDFGPLMTELRQRWNLLSGLRGDSGAKTFRDQFHQIDIRFSGVSAATPAMANLTLGWSNYRGLLNETEGGSFTTTVRAAEVFEPLDEPARSLEWWANILVAVGLVITFLGIVAALTEATSTIATGGEGATEGALMGLLTIAATKFWTSIAGVLASIILRIAARIRRKRLQAAQASLYEALDACVRLIPPERLMLEQLQSLRRIEAALTKG